MFLSSWPFSRPGDMLQLYVVWDMINGDKDSCQPYIFYVENEALRKEKIGDK